MKIKKPDMELMFLIVLSVSALDRMLDNPIMENISWTVCTICFVWYLLAKYKK